jgi:hypothetical protein
VTSSREHFDIASGIAATSLSGASFRVESEAECVEDLGWLGVTRREDPCSHNCHSPH